VTDENASLLKTAEEAAKILGHITAHTIRSMARRREIAYVRGPRGKILLTDEQIVGIISHLTQAPHVVMAPEPQPMGVDTMTSARSQALNRGRRGGHE
jgi:hypothetical protein